MQLLITAQGLSENAHCCLWILESVHLRSREVQRCYCGTSTCLQSREVWTAPQELKPVFRDDLLGLRAGVQVQELQSEEQKAIFLLGRKLG